MSSDLLGQFVDLLYLYAVKKDEIIELLKEQIERLRDDNSRLLDQIGALMEEVSSLGEALLQRDESLSKRQRPTRGLARLVSNTPEQQQAPQSAISEEERQRMEAKKVDKHKARKNNGAKHDIHYEMEEEGYVVYPDNPDFNIDKARLFTTVPRMCVCYEYVPMRFIRHVYKIHTYTQEGRLFEGKTLASAFLSSSYDGSSIVELMKLHYIQSLPTERIINYFENHDFTLKRPTTYKLIEKASNFSENLYKCIQQTALSDPYRTADETYCRILVPERNSKGRGVRKEYLWVVTGIGTRIMYLLYGDGSRSERVVLNELGSCKSIIQGDGYSPYRKLESDAYPSITRIPCLQHVRRKFINCGEKDSDAERIVELISALYQSEHRHKVRVERWTIEQNLMHRKKYTPDILGEIKDMLDEIEERGDLLLKSELQEATACLRNEWNAVVDIFNYGSTHLGNNMVERVNRYMSLSRKNSLFFGSHKGAERGTVLHTIALTCRIHKMNLFEYLVDVINRTAEWQPNTPIEEYRELLPNRWEKAND